jgi:uncharacterized membrane-anchored protein YjiN (DUF445 family)
MQECQLLPYHRHMSSVSLSQMKHIALALLAGAAVLYTGAAMLQNTHPAWRYVAAFSEAAMVGAVADWFAVVALFRHPLGLPIPHTSIIASQKNRLGESLATFISTHFLSAHQLLSKLQQWNAGAHLSAWLIQPQHAQQVAQHFSSTLSHTLKTLDTQALQQQFVSTLVQRLTQLDAAHLAGEMLHMLTAGEHHRLLLDDLLRHLGTALDDDTLKEKIADVVADEVKYLRFVGLDAVAGRYATSKMVTGVVKLVGEMSQNPEHPLRLRFNRFMVSFANRLQSDPLLHNKGENIKQELLAHPQLTRYLHTLWHDMMNWTQNDLAQNHSVLQGLTTQAAQHLSRQLGTDTALQQWFNQQLQHTVSALIEPSKTAIHRYIVARVNEWDATEMTHELEKSIGRDLQFIRINGTLVGGLVGLLIYSTTQFIRNF